MFVISRIAVGFIMSLLIRLVEWLRVYSLGSGISHCQRQEIDDAKRLLLDFSGGWQCNSNDVKYAFILNNNTNILNQDLRCFVRVRCASSVPDPCLLQVTMKMS